MYLATPSQMKAAEANAVAAGETYIGLMENAGAAAVQELCRCVDINADSRVLIICGSKDKANLKSASLLSELLPNASLATIKDAGHEVNLESPADFAHLVSAFYKRISRQP